MTESKFALKVGATVREAWMQASSFLHEQGVEDADSSAEWMICHLLRVDRGQFFLRWQEVFPEVELPNWCAMIERRALGEPAQYIIGEHEFFGNRLEVDGNVLIPRPETELLVEQVLVRSARLNMRSEVRVADIGTGSGAIPISLALERPDWQFVAVDLSEKALAVARRNMTRYELTRRIQTVVGDGLAPFIEGAFAAPEILISNPPYIPLTDLPQLQREVRDHEPHLALFGGHDGLAVYRLLVAQLQQLTNPPSLIAFEMGIGQAPAVMTLLQQLPFAYQIECIRDFASIERMVFATLLR
jgi:release factor glutamine methyltransferase